MASIKKLPNGKWRARYRDAEGKEHARHFKFKDKPTKPENSAQCWFASNGQYLVSTHRAFERSPRLEKG